MEENNEYTEKNDTSDDFLGVSSASAYSEESDKSEMPDGTAVTETTESEMIDEEEYDDDYDDIAETDVQVNDFGNVSDEDYDNESDKESMRAFYIIAITVLCVIIIGVGLFITSRFFPDIFSFSEPSSGKAQSGGVVPSVNDPDTDDGEGESKDDATPVPTPSVDVDSTVSENNGTASVDGSTPLSVTEIYESCVNSVVGITTEGTTTNIFGHVSKNASSGTGIVYSSDGYILTNYHVVESGSTHTVTFYDGKSYKAKLVGFEAANDVALLKIDVTGLKNAYIGNSDKISVGEDVVVIGNPLGELTYTLTRGVVSALNRVINTDSTPKNMFQIDAAVNSGNSGGPAFDEYGRVIGIVTAKYSDSTVEGIGFCIPINDAVNIAEELKTYGYVRGKAGLEICATDSYLTYGNGWFNSYAIYGAKVTYTKNGGAAALAGMTSGDMIVEIDGTAVATVTELQAVLKTKSIGSEITIVAYHSDDGRSFDKKTYKITLGEASPLNVPEDYSAEKYGSVI